MSRLFITSPASTRSKQPSPLVLIEAVNSQISIFPKPEQTGHHFPPNIFQRHMLHYQDRPQTKQETEENFTAKYQARNRFDSFQTLPAVTAPLSPKNSSAASGLIIIPFEENNSNEQRFVKRSATSLKDTPGVISTLSTIRVAWK